jgi:hypothetical protein
MIKSLNIDSLTDRAFSDVILSGKYFCKSFVGIVDKEVETGGP